MKNTIIPPPTPMNTKHTSTPPIGTVAWSIDKMEDFLRTIVDDDKEKFTSLLPSTPQDACNEALVMAARLGHAHFVVDLLLCADPHADSSRALSFAAAAGHSDIVQILIPVSNPKDQNSHALRRAAGNGHLRCVELLIPVSDPKALNSLALRNAALSGHAHIVEVLLAVSDPKANDSIALSCAALQKHTPCIDLLYAVSDPPQALAWLKKNPSPEGVEFLLQYIAQRDRTVLASHAEQNNQLLRKKLPQSKI